MSRISLRWFIIFGVHLNWFIWTGTLQLEGQKKIIFRSQYEIIRKTHWSIFLKISEMKSALERLWSVVIWAIFYFFTFELVLILVINYRRDFSMICVCSPSAIDVQTSVVRSELTKQDYWMGNLLIGCDIYNPMIKSTHIPSRSK